MKHMILWSRVAFLDNVGCRDPEQPILQDEGSQRSTQMHRFSKISNHQLNRLFVLQQAKLAQHWWHFFSFDTSWEKNHFPLNNYTDLRIISQIVGWRAPNSVSLIEYAEVWLKIGTIVRNNIIPSRGLVFKAPNGLLVHWPLKTNISKPAIA